MSLKKETVRYQMTQFFFAALTASYASSTAFCLQYVSYYGRYWYFFPMFCVGWNDASAYFLGRTFGRTKLISLSPKKTVEGFVGALLSNVIATFLYLDYWLRDNNFWTCAPMQITWHPFQDYECQEVHYIYHSRVFKLPFSFLGLDSFTCSPAVLYSMVYVVFAAIIAPFAGFLASGLKRAYGIKDFAATLPGHGGFTDRLDCISIQGMFSYVLLSTVIYRNEVTAEKAYRAIIGLDSSEQQSILSLLAN